MEAKGNRRQGHKDRAGDRKGAPKETSKPFKVSRIEGVPVLKAGKHGNLRVFMREFAVYAKSTYKDLGTLIETREYYVPPEIEYDLDEVRPARGNDVQATLLLETLKQKMKNRINAIDRMKNDRPGLYADLWGQLSPDSEDLVKRHADYAIFSMANDPKGLLDAIYATHQYETTSIGRMDKKKARDRFHAVTQGHYELITNFKERFDFAYNAYKDAGNADIEDGDLAMDFFDALNENQFGKFRTNMLDAVAYQGAIMPANLSDMYAAALAHRGNHAESRGRHSHEATFAHYDGGRGGGKRGGARGGRDRHAKGDNGDRECWGCGSKDHLRRDCPNANNTKRDSKSGDSNERGSESKKITAISAKEKGNAHFVNYALLAQDEGWLSMTDVLLDNQANISTFKNKNLLVDIAYMDE